MPPTAPVELIRKELPFPAFVYNLTLAGVAQTVTVPANVSWALIGTDDTIWIRTGGTAAAGGTASDGTGSWPILPRDVVEARRFNVRGVATFSVFGAAANVGVAFYRDQSDGVYQ